MADHQDHHEHDEQSLGFATITISSSRSEDEDRAGDWVQDRLTETPHDLVDRHLEPDSIQPIRATLRRCIENEDIDVVVTLGGTGVTPDDVTPEAVQPLLDRRLPGFGERYRARSVDQIGERVIASRAVGGIAGDTLVCSVPGSTAAVELAFEALLLPQAPHLVGLARRPTE